MSQLNIYNVLLKKHQKSSYDATLKAIIGPLINVWIEDYRKATKSDVAIVEFEDKGFTFLFDQSEDFSTAFVRGRSKEPRVVVVFGRAINASEVRNKSRMQGFLRGFQKTYPGYDRGHFIAHATGGMLDQNLFPQKSTVNRGQGEEGGRYRTIERYTASHPDIFMFSRPIYNDPSWIPQKIEIGYLSKDFNFVVEKVSN